MAKKETVEATWVAPFEASLPDGTVLIPGETKVMISRGEAEASANWAPKGSKANTKPSAPKAPTKKDIVKQLEEKNIPFDPRAKKADLEELLANPEAAQANETNIPGAEQVTNPEPEGGE